MVRTKQSPNSVSVISTIEVRGEHTEVINKPSLTPKLLRNHHSPAPTNPAAPVPEANQPRAVELRFKPFFSVDVEFVEGLVYKVDSCR